MAILSTAAERLVQLGANIEITAEAKYLAPVVEKFIQIAKATGAHVTVHADNYLAPTLERFAQIGGNSVTFKL